MSEQVNRRERKLAGFDATGNLLGGRVITGLTDEQVEATKNQIIRDIADKRKHSVQKVQSYIRWVISDGGL